MDKALEQIKITEEILDLMSKDYYFPMVLFIILITVICMFLGILIILLDKKI